MHGIRLFTNVGSKQIQLNSKQIVYIHCSIFLSNNIKGIAVLAGNLHVFHLHINVDFFGCAIHTYLH